MSTTPTFLRAILRFIGITPTPHLVSAGYNWPDKVMTLAYSDGRTKQFKGSCAVWRSMPSFRRCSATGEEQLSNIRHYIENYGNPWPDAHLKQPPTDRT
jgi:hypothetical protein